MPGQIGNKGGGRKPLYDEIKLKRVAEKAMDFLEMSYGLPGGSKNKDFDKILFEASVKLTMKAMPQMVIQENDAQLEGLKGIEGALKGIANNK